MIKTTFYNIKTSVFGKAMRIALVADLHAQSPTPVIDALRGLRPDMILMPGDIFERLDGSCDEKNEKIFELLEFCAELAPTFFSVGNHEDGGTHSWKPQFMQKSKPRVYTVANVERIRATGVKFLLDEYLLHDGIAIGGLASGVINETKAPNLEFLKEFAALDAPKILLCHHPEYYPKYIKSLDVDLTVSGHAHGGQWRFFGRGLYAPGQGLFPRYTSGVHDLRLVVSRGLRKTVFPPRIFNEPELVVIDIEL